MRVAGSKLAVGAAASTVWAGAAVLTVSGAVMTKKTAAIVSAKAASKQTQPQPRRQRASGPVPA